MKCLCIHCHGLLTTAPRLCSRNMSECPGESLQDNVMWILYMSPSVSKENTYSGLSDGFDRSSTQGGSGDDGSPGTIQIPLDPTSSSNSLLADTFLTTPTSTLFQNPISPLGQGGELSWPDSKSPSSTANASKAMGPNAFPDPKKK
jgi:hypothetical protein